MIDHVVLLRVRPDTTADELDALGRALGALPARIDGVMGVRWGANTSPEGLERGFTHGFVMQFRDEAARRAYLPHPAHRVVADEIGRISVEVLVFDVSV